MAPRVVPILPVRDLRAALAHYERLGFVTREYADGGFGFASLDGVEIYLEVVSEFDVRPAAYFFIGDADELARAWRSVGVEVTLPRDTDWGMHEGEHVDPDGNIIRFGSPMNDADAG